MNRKLFYVSSLLLATSVALAEDPPKAKAKEDPKELEGISILGNQEAPKALVIVPWKSSELGAAVGVAPLLDDSRAPVDKDVFLRSLSYYEIRSETAKRSKS